MFFLSLNSAFKGVSLLSSFPLKKQAWRFRLMYLFQQSAGTFHEKHEQVLYWIDGKIPKNGETE